MTRAGAPVIFTADTATDSQDFLKKEEADNLYINLNEPYSSNLNMNNNKIVNLSNPVVSSDAANKAYVDNNFVSKSQSPNIESNLNMNSNRITNISEGVDDNDAVNVKQVETIIDREIPIRVRVRTSESYGDFVAVTTTTDHPLFSDYFIYAIVIDFQVHCHVYNESTPEQYISISDQRLANQFQKRVKIENRWFILTAGIVQQTGNIIIDGAYKLTYLYFI
jgi:hypothetical protein